MEVFRTADYKILESAKVSGITRLIGAFPEASRYSDFAAPLGVYFIAHYMGSARQMSLYLGMVTIALAILSLSSTGFVAVGAAALYAIAISLKTRRRVRRIMFMIVPLAIATLAITIVMPGLVSDVMSRLIFEKGDSISGLERGIWLARGWQTAVETYF